jgi:hypothetical protein
MAPDSEAKDDVAKPFQFHSAAPLGERFAPNDEDHAAMVGGDLGDVVGRLSAISEWVAE